MKVEVGALVMSADIAVEASKAIMSDLGAASVGSLINEPMNQQSTYFISRTRHRRPS